MNPDEKIASLEARLNQAVGEREKIDAMNELAYALRSKDLARAEALTEEALAHALRLLHRYGVASAFRNKGIFAYQRGNYDEALKFLGEASNWFQKIPDVRGHASVLNNKGLTYWKLGEHGKAMECYMSALAINLQMKDKVNQCGTLINIGGLYQTMGNLEQAKDFYSQALDIAIACELYYEWGTVLSNIGAIHYYNNEKDKALDYFLKSLEIREKTNQEREISVSLLNAGAAYFDLGETEKGLAMMRKSLERRRAMNDKYGEAHVLQAIGHCFFARKDFAQAVEYLLQSLVIIQDIKAKALEKQTRELLALSYKELGDYRNAYEQHVRFHDIEKELLLEQSEEKTKRLMIRYELDKSQREAELYRLKNEDLVRLNAELQQANQLKTELLSIAAHDLKNPLQTIMGFADLICEEAKQNESVFKKAASIRRASQKMLGLIQDLLQTAAIESGKLELRKRKADLGALVQTISENFSLMAENKRQKLDIAVESDCVVDIDVERMKEVIENLVGNAIKYSPPDKTIWIEVKRVQGKARFSVRDEGQGLTEDDMKKLFGKFQRLSAKPTGGESSTGLGLSIVKRLVEMHGGKVWAESEGKDKGATFIVELDCQTG
ncbi:MAG: tetratricopeptide repeat-containing sensor histidine kinase [Chloroherpetonaceae bacterium]|nr:tetratricopeptide repeat-containing sensor histidine kinase [Chloroherpetonaceae bacterium]